MDGYGTFIIIVGILALARIFTTKADIRRMEELEARENAMDEWYNQQVSERSNKSIKE